MNTRQFQEINSRRVNLIIKLLEKKELSLEEWEELGFLQSRVDEYLGEFYPELEEKWANLDQSALTAHIHGLKNPIDAALSSDP